MEFIYFSSFKISLNFPYQLVTNMCELVLEDLAPFGNGSMVIVIFPHKLKNTLVRNLEFI